MTELEKLVEEINNSTDQVAINKVDEVRVMQAMLNDKEFTLSVYDKNKGYIGQRSPYQEARTFTKNIISGATGLESKDAQHLADHYEFTKRDSNFLLQNMRDFTQVYMTTGRKMNILQTDKTEATINTREMKASTKKIPDKENPSITKSYQTSPFIKLVAKSKRPKYYDQEVKRKKNEGK